MYVYVCIICIFVCRNTYRNLVYKYTSMNVCNDCIDMCLQQSSHIKHDCFVCRANEFPKYLLVLFKHVVTNKKYVVHCHNGLNCFNTNIQYWHMQCINIHIKNCCRMFINCIVWIVLFFAMSVVFVIHVLTYVDC